MVSSEADALAVREDMTPRDAAGQAAPAPELALGRPSFADAVEIGMTWFALHHRCPIAWPSVASLRRRARTWR